MFANRKDNNKVKNKQAIVLPTLQSIIANYANAVWRLCKCLHSNHIQEITIFIEQKDLSSFFSRLCRCNHEENPMNFYYILNSKSDSLFIRNYTKTTIVSLLFFSPRTIPFFGMFTSIIFITRAVSIF